MSTVFLGTSEFAAAILQRLAQSEQFRPALALTRPDRPSGRGRRMASPPVAERARELGIALAQPDSVNSAEARARIAHAGAEQGLAPQTVIVCAFGALIKEPLLSEHALLNVHPSLLPRWRGAAPIERAIMAGDERSGVCIMRLTAGLDSGPVCLSADEPVLANDTYGSLAARLQDLGGELLIRALREQPPFIEQPEDGVTYAEKIAPEDRLLDPNRPAVELDRRVRALTPHIGARVALADGSLLGVHSAALLGASSERAGQPGPSEPAAQPGVSERAVGPDVSERATQPGVAERDGRLLLDCAPGVLELLVVQPPGGRAMDAAAYLRGHGAPGRR